VPNLILYRTTTLIRNEKKPIGRLLVNVINLNRALDILYRVTNIPENRSVVFFLNKGYGKKENIRKKSQLKQENNENKNDTVLDVHIIHVIVRQTF
tara:strand:- start:379 stop:666 length:288 start_codon:yes stop_codon:yes gene_type:complete